MDRVLRIRYPRGSKHEHVPVDEVRAAFALCFGPGLRRIGFRPCRTHVWVADQAAPVRHVVLLRGARGGYDVLFGLKFDFVPYITDAGDLRMHSDNDPDTWAIDLIHDPYAEIGHDEPRPFRFGVTSVLGGPVMERQMRRERRRLIRRIGSFVRSTRSLADALNAYHQEQARKFAGLGYENRVSHWVSYPYVLMANGRQDDAHTSFQTYIDRFPQHANHRSKLGQLLEAAAGWGDS